MSQVLTQAPCLGDLIKREFDKNYDREIVTLKEGIAYVLGCVLGKVTATGVYTLSPAASTEGIEGAEIGCAVLAEDVDATGGDTAAIVLARGPVIVAEHALIFDSSVDSDEARTIKRDELAAHGIVSR
jgi:hypothetical protein